MGSGTEREAGRRERQQSTGRDFLSIYEANIFSHESEHSIGATDRGSSTSRESEGQEGGEGGGGDDGDGGHHEARRDDGPEITILGYNRLQRAPVTSRKSVSRGRARYNSNYGIPTTNKSSCQRCRRLAIEARQSIP